MKEFYIIKKQTSDPYEMVCFLANNMRGITVLLETRFAQYAGIHDSLYSIDSEKKESFESKLKEHGYSYQNMNLWSEYSQWVAVTKYNKPKLNADFVKNSTILSIGEYEIPKIVETDTGAQYSTEQEICRKDQIKIYTHSNELCGHHIPHIHIAYGDDWNYCVISLVDLSVIEPCGYNGAKIKKSKEILAKHLNESRLAWNKTNGIIKFVIDKEGNPTSNTSKIR